MNHGSVVLWLSNSREPLYLISLKENERKWLPEQERLAI